MSRRLCLHPNFVLPAYQRVHNWLQERAPNYRRRAPNINQSNTLATAGANFDSFNHLHAFKAQTVIEDLIANNRIPKLFIPNVKHVIVDIACGSGAASVGLINSLVQKGVLDNIPKPLHLFFVGLDPDVHALEIYTQYLNELKETLTNAQIIIDFRCVHKGVPEGVLDVTDHINKFRNGYISGAKISSFILFQMNAVNPFTERDNKEMSIRIGLKARGIPIGDETNNAFNKSVFNAYRLLCDETHIEEGILVTIGTNEPQWQSAVANTGSLIEQVFSEHRHDIENWTGEMSQRSFFWKHPEDSRRYKDFGQPKTPQLFFADIHHFVSRDLIQDTDWNDITNLENLKLAWVRARRYQMRESLVDELEIIIFEQNLNANLEDLSHRLRVYLDDVANTSSRLPYTFPKRWNPDQSDIVPRPRVLTRFEEDVIAVAIVQVLGRKIDIPNSFEYRLENSATSSEFLYEYYLKGYQDWVQKIRSEAERPRNKNGVILQTDIQSFYTDIHQGTLVESVSNSSDRIRWLLQQILERLVPESQEMLGVHRKGYGLVQGGTASGFFAKLYLKPLHEPFGPSEQGIELYRYADDIAVIIPQKGDEQDVRTDLSQRLQSLQLRLSKNKTKSYSSQEYLSKIASQDDLDEIDKEIKNEILNRLYTLPPDYRDYLHQCNDADQWWDSIVNYQRRLKRIGIFFQTSWLSRKIQEYLKPKDVKLLRFPELADFIDVQTTRWEHHFSELNESWRLGKLFPLRAELIHRLIEAWEGYKTGTGRDEVLARWHLTRFRFFTSKLVVLGFDEALPLIIEAMKQPGVLRNPRWTLEAIVNQNATLEFLDLLTSFRERNLKTDGYMRAILARTIRFLPDEFQHNYSSTLAPFLVEIAFNGSIAEKLMATESLILGVRFPNIDYCKFEELLSSVDAQAYPQFYRNVLLILKIYCNSKVVSENELQHWNEKAIHFAYRVDEELLTSLKKYHEHDEARNYYSHEYPDMDDQEGPYPW